MTWRVELAGSGGPRLPKGGPIQDPSSENRFGTAASDAAGPDSDASVSDASALSAGRRVRLVAGVMVASVVTVMILLWLLTSGVLGGAAPAGPYLDLGIPYLPGILLVAAAVLLVAAPLVERYLLSRPPMTAAAEPAEPTAPLDRYVSVKVATLGLREAVGIIGLFIGLMGDPRMGFVVGAASLLALAFGWPREDEIRAAARG